MSDPTLKIVESGDETNPTQQPAFLLARICWVDSRGVSESWAPLEQLREHDLCHVWSVGWIINETEEFIQVCPHLGTDPDQGCGDMTIAKQAIVRIEYDDDGPQGVVR